MSFSPRRTQHIIFANKTICTLSWETLQLRYMRFNNSVIAVSALLWFIKLSCRPEKCTMIQIPALIKGAVRYRRRLQSSLSLLCLSLTRLCVSLSASHTNAHTCPSQSSVLFLSCLFFFFFWLGGGTVDRVTCSLSARFCPLSVKDTGPMACNPSLRRHLMRVCVSPLEPDSPCLLMPKCNVKSNKHKNILSCC